MYPIKKPIRSQGWNTYIRARTTSVLRALGQRAPPRASTHPRVPRGLPACLAPHALPPAMPRPRPAPCVPHAARDCACPPLVMICRRACPCAAPPRTAARCRSARARAPRRLAPRAHRARCHRLSPWAHQLRRRSCAAAAPAATKAGTRDCHARYHDPEYGHTLWYGMSPSERAASVYPKL